MADYNQIKTLTIDGTTLGMVEGLGETTRADKNITSFPTSWSWTEGASITVSPGVYFLKVYADIPNRTTIGVTNVGIAVRTSEGDSLFNKFATGNNEQVIIASYGVTVARSDTTYKAIVACARGVTGNTVATQIAATKLVEIPST